MAEDGLLQQETEGQTERLTESELRRKKWESRRVLVLTIECLKFGFVDELPDKHRRKLFYEAVRKGELDVVEKLLSKTLFKMTLLRPRFTQFEENALQVAVAAGQKEMLRELMKKVNTHSCRIKMLKKKNRNGETILTLAVARGSIEIVKELVDTCVELVDIPNKKGELPVTLAALLGKKEIVTFLFDYSSGMDDSNPSGGDVEEDVVMTNSIQSSQGVGDFKLLKVSMTTQFSGHDERNYSFKLVSEDGDQVKPAYQSRHHCFRLFKACIHSEIYGLERWESCQLCLWFERFWKFLLPKSWYENNYNQTKSAELLLRRIYRYMWMSEIPYETMQRVLTRPILTAAEQGNTISIDKIRTLNLEIPLDFNKSLSHDDFKMSISALENPATGLLRAIHGDTNRNTILHHAAMLSSAKELSRFRSPSLQMQSEMQRFKNAEKSLFMFKGVENNDNLTPWNLFVEQHRNLKNEGEKWLKETASSCSILAVLIVTVMFSAAFTVPGGYENDTGRPVYLGSKYFTVFVISDALSLLFSSTSAMVFLGIYTSLFREEDFLKRLPLTLICGLFTLFLSITTMVIAFSAALILTLREDFVWITLPVLMSASIPVIIYSVLNIPIFVNVLYSTLFSH